MTAAEYNPADDVAQQFLAALPPAVRAHVHHTGRITLYVHRAVHMHGWTVPQLVARCTGDLGVNPGGTITHRLERDSAGPPPTAGSRPKVHDGCCEDGWIYNETTDPPTITKCHGTRQDAH